LAYSTSSTYKGSLVVLATSGMASTRQHGPLTAADVETAGAGSTQPAFPNPFPMADHVRLLLSNAMSAAAPFTAGARDAQLSLVVNRVSVTEYLVALANTDLLQQNFKIVSNVGAIDGVKEIVLPDAALAKTAFDNDPGYAPTGFSKVPRGVSSESTIAGIEQRIFKVTLKAETATLLPTVEPAAAPHRIALPMPQTTDLRDSISLRPSFRQHFDAVVLDWTYVERRSAKQLQIEGRWAFMRGVSILVDFTSGLNLYPDLRLCNNSIEYEQSIQRMRSVLSKMKTKVNASTATIDRAFSSVAIVSEHRAPENGQSYYKTNHTETRKQCQNDTRAAFALLGKAFPAIEIHLQTTITGRGNFGGNPTPNATLELAAMGNLVNIKIAAHVGNAVLGQAPTRPLPAPALVGSLFVAAPSYDPHNAQPAEPLRKKKLPLHFATSSPLATLSANGKTGYAAALKSRGANAWIVLDASMPLEAYEGLNAAEDAEFAEVSELEKMLRA